jgi:osmoprotectant transport system ATP-binding protein
MIRLHNVFKSFDDGATFAVRDISFEVEQGQFMIILGESGCGKTTTLKMINRLVDMSSGEIFVDGQETSGFSPVKLRRKIGYVFQGIGLFPHMSVAENVGAVPRLLGWKKAERTARSSELLDLVGLPANDYSDRLPAQLSGGQQQRVGLARALAARPKVMLMDEPFGALDPITRENLQQEFASLQKKLGLTVVMVTHDVTEALLLADRIGVMNEGRLLQGGTPHELLAEPADEYIASLMETPKRQTEIIRRLEQENGD